MCILYTHNILVLFKTNMYFNKPKYFFLIMIIRRANNDDYLIFYRFKLKK